jgi:hypothetical protein
MADGKDATDRYIREQAAERRAAAQRQRLATEAEATRLSQARYAARQGRS